MWTPSVQGPSERTLQHPLVPAVRVILSEQNWLLNFNARAWENSVVIYRRPGGLSCLLT